jgi:hypothetical protein
LNIYREIETGKADQLDRARAQDRLVRLRRHQERGARSEERVRGDEGEGSLSLSHSLSFTRALGANLQ